MPESSVVDFSELLAAVAGDNPCGKPVPYEVRQQLEDGRKEDNPEDYAPDDPARPETIRRADWLGIIRTASTTLGRTSKDLLVAARLTEALARLHQFAGLRDGLRLMRELADQYWDQLYPAIEDGDLEVRAGPFNWLDDNIRGIHFPDAVRALPMLKGDLSWIDWHRSQKGQGEVTAEAFDKAVLNTSADDCVRTADEIGECLSEIDRLKQLLNDRMGPVAPGLNALREAVINCRTLMGQIVAQKRPAGAAETDIRSDASDAAGSGSARAVTNRAEAYRQLAQAAAVLQELEPHSPIPYLVKRAVELGSLSFPELIAKLIRDDNVLGELSRELGIKREQAS